ncbi:hypothetical protein AYI70_g7051 [Smittium culicis]|uniref:Uncharacterized protein n=1 Tax=Smittium culicis TaxID=133412 RepID=A0A1R1XMB1_9FUNG|nr:hypothetical protein AYI70_g7051 [Smittium culicis]
MEERLLLPTVKLDPSSNPESLQKTTEINTSNPTAAIFNVVSRTKEILKLTKNIINWNSCGYRPQKRKFSFKEKLIYVFNELEHQQCALLG